MLDFIKKLFSEYKIELVGAVTLGNCHIVRPYKLKDFDTDDFSSLTAIMIAVPYLTYHEKRNISAYAVSRDYHLFFEQIFDSILSKIKEKYPQNKFISFADNSPIDERYAAAACGLGIIGDNGMLITEKYSSYVFLGEIVTDLKIDSKPQPITRCYGCGKCRSVCPMGEIGECLSALTQKKGELTPKEQSYILKYQTAWGCDICQEVCPYTLEATKNGTIYTDIDFFRENTTPYLTGEILEQMSDEEFQQRAYSWRKRETITRNLKILENNLSDKE